MSLEMINHEPNTGFHPRQITKSIRFLIYLQSIPNKRSKKKRVMIETEERMISTVAKPDLRVGLKTALRFHNNKSKSQPVGANGKMVFLAR